MIKYGAVNDGARLGVLARDALDQWKLFLLLMLLSFFLSVVVVRMIPPQYEATTKIIAVDDAGSGSPLSIIPGAASLFGQKSSIDEFRAVAASRRLADAMVKDDRLRDALSAKFSPGKPGMVGKFGQIVATSVFGKPQPTNTTLPERIHLSLERDLKVDIKGSIATITYAHPDREFAKVFIQGALDHGQEMVTERQREKAVAYQDYILNLMVQNLDGNAVTLRTLASIVPSAISQAARLNGPTSRSFDQIDSVNVSVNPVKPRIGLIVAVCLALGMGMFAFIVYLRRAV